MSNQVEQVKFGLKSLNQSFKDHKHKMWAKFVPKSKPR